MQNLCSYFCDKLLSSQGDKASFQEKEEMKIYISFICFLE